MFSYLIKNLFVFAFLISTIQCISSCTQTTITTTITTTICSPIQTQTQIQVPPPLVNCINLQYSCGPINTLGQGTVVQCINNQLVHIDNCDDPGTNTCKMIGNAPYCVLNS